MSEEGLNSPHSAENNDGAAEAQSSPGQQLAARRQAEGWTIEQVAAQLKLAPRQIEAIEADHLNALPGTMVARGFIRSYARLLRMDPAPLLAMISVDMRSPIESIRQQRPLSAPFSETRLPSMHAPKASQSWMPALLLVLAAIAGIWGVRQVDWHAVLPESLSARLGWSEPAPTVAAPAAAEQPEMAALPAAANDPAPKASSSAADKLVPSMPAPVATAEPVAAAVAASEPAPAPNNQLNLTVHQDSWIEIKRPDSSVLVSRLAKAGTTETFEIVEPVLLVVGNAAGVEASLRNAPLDLKSTTSTNVARIHLK